MSYKNDPLLRAFSEQKYNARRRKIGWHLTFEQWLRIWQTSGHLHERGHRSGCYVMARHRDRGPYAPDNVAIVPVSKNNGDGSRGKKQTKRQRETTAQIVKQQWADMTPKQRAARGRAVSEAQIRTGSNKAIWQDLTIRRKHTLALKRAWARLTSEQRAARGAAVSEGKRRAREQLRIVSRDN